MNVRTKTINNITYYTTRITKNCKSYSIYAKTKKELKEKYENKTKELELMDSQGIVYNNKKLKEHINDYMILKKPTIRPTTYTTLNHYFMHIIKSNLGNKKPKDINLSQWQHFFNNLLLSNSSKKSLKLVTSGLFKYLEMNQIISHNTIRGVIIKTDDTNTLDDNYMEPQQQEEFITNIKGDKYELDFLILLYCGLRYGELRALTVKDIDIKNRTININKSWIRYRENDGYRDCEGPCKNKSSIRIICYPSLLDDLVNKRLKYCDKYPFPYHKNTLNHWLKRYVNLHLHSLRHTAISNWFNDGIPLEIIQRMCGHTVGSSTTLRVYAKLNDKRYMDMMKDYFNK
ncbi:site-specific integrase [Clostridium sp. YIM B02555]|uniref:tyrosine-type recombinase/integrase n=1 Tax=Clostridium sp. YIM B02555 TaxID=2911968 RepID=UPI001EEF60D7|nr:site-specific integrase [Clostridium sp. YIM B02555]